MSHIRFSFSPQDKLVRPADTPVTEAGQDHQAIHGEVRASRPLTRHVGKDIPIYDGQRNRIGTGRVTDLRFGMAMESPEHIQVDLDIEFDNPLRRIDLTSLYDFEFSLGDESEPPSKAEGKPITAIYVNRHTETITGDYPGDDQVEFSPGDAKLAVYAWGLASFTVISDFVHGKKPRFHLDTVEELRRKLFSLATEQPGRWTSVLVDEKTATALLAPRHAPVRDTVVIEVTPGPAGMRIQRVDVPEAEALLAVHEEANRPGNFVIRYRRDTLLAATAGAVSGIARRLRELRMKHEKITRVTVVIDRELAKQVTDS